LIETSKGKPFVLIGYQDFGFELRSPIQKNLLVIFIDDNMQTKILKNRWGDMGIVKK
jgi:hypothetical protein